MFRDKLYDPVPGRVLETLDAPDEFSTSEPEFDDAGEWTGEGADGTRSILDIRAVGASSLAGTGPLARSSAVSVRRVGPNALPCPRLSRPSAMVELLTRILPRRCSWDPS